MPLKHLSDTFLSKVFESTNGRGNLLSKSLFLVVIFKFGYSINPFLRFEAVDDLKDKICPKSDIVFTTDYHGYGNSGFALCTSTCGGFSECNGIFYNVDISTCVGCSGFYNASNLLDDSIGTTYFRKFSKGYMQRCYPGDVCVEDNQECFTDTCICSLGLSYNPSNGTCVTECESYGTTFQVYPGRRLNNNNIYVLRNMSTFQGCINECLSNPDCVSIDYELRNTRCNVQNITAFSKPNQLKLSNYFTYCTRDCS